MSENTEADEVLSPGCGLWLGWIFTSILGAGLGWAGGWRLSFITPGLVSTIVIGMTMGMIMGFFQWLVLRGRIARARLWAPASAAGWALGFSLGAEAAFRLEWVGAAFGLLIGIATGLCVGVFQWAILRPSVTRAWIWIPVSVFAWTASLIYYQPGVTILGALFGALTGFVTGTAMLWLIYRPVPDPA
jgi:hypothetical protein